MQIQEPIACKVYETSLKYYENPDWLKFSLLHALHNFWYWN